MRPAVHLLIMLGNGLRCMVLGDEVFSQHIDPMLLQEIFQPPFSNNNNKKKEKKNLPAGGTPETHVMKTGSSRIFKRMVPVDYSYQSKQKYQEPFLFLSNNSLASFLSQMSNLVHSSGHPGLPATTCICRVSLLPIVTLPHTRHTRQLQPF